MTIKRVKESFAHASSDGTMVTLTAGQLVDTDKFDITGKESLFEDVDTYVGRQEANKQAQSTTAKPSVETATAEPGEKRNVSTSPSVAPKREFKPPARKDNE